MYLRAGIESLASIVKIRMSESQTKAMERLDAEDFTDVVRQYSQYSVDVHAVYLSSGHCEDSVKALKQYYALTIFDPFGMHVLSPAVLLAALWRMHMLNTDQYESLFEDIGDGQHDNALDYRDTEDDRFLLEKYQYTLRVLDRIFGKKNIDPFLHTRNPIIGMLACKDIGAYIRTSQDFLNPDKTVVRLKDRYRGTTQRRRILESLSAV